MRDLISRRLHLEEPPEGGKSRLLFSVLVIAAALALVGGATFALFSDPQTATGTVNAGSIDLCIDDVTGGGDSACNEAILADQENMLPGQTVTWTIDLQNTGNREWDVDLTSVDKTGTTGAECDGSNGGEDFTVEFVRGPDTGSDDHSTTLIHVAPAASQHVDVKVSLRSDAGNTCQTASYALTAKFTAQQHP